MYRVLAIGFFYHQCPNREKPWQMVAADVPEVPVSSNNNRYLLVVQDYFTKWVEVVPMPDQTATRIVSALTKIFDNPSGGHLGYEKTLHKLQQEAYWVYMHVTRCRAVL